MDQVDFLSRIQCPSPQSQDTFPPLRLASPARPDLPGQWIRVTELSKGCWCPLLAII